VKVRKYFSQGKKRTTDLKEAVLIILRPWLYLSHLLREFRANTKSNSSNTRITIICSNFALSQQGSKFKIEVPRMILLLSFFFLQIVFPCFSSLYLPLASFPFSCVCISLHSFILLLACMNASTKWKYRTDRSRSCLLN